MNSSDAVARQALGRAVSLFEEFKAFALKGNVVDLAIGVIIGTAFGKVVSAMVTDVLMPIALWPVQKAGGAEELTKGLTWKLGSEKNVLDLGAFINEIVSFVIVAAALFIFIVKFLGWIMHNKKQEAVAPPPPTKDQELLMEIRDLLKQRVSGERPSETI
ncbi:MAG TPA: large conductance mechanosensitive channel protein MscL [Planctomycetaceae bacterium]|jgi:large conductance mechanosensitive channel